MNLYEISNSLLNLIDKETGEIADIELFDNLEMERDTKLENIALWIKNLKADVEAFKNEKQVFADRQKQAETKIESLQNYLTTFLNGSKFETPKVKVSFRKSESVVINNTDIIPKEFLKVKTEIDKAGIKELLKKGEVVAGAELQTNNNIQIK